MAARGSSSSTRLPTTGRRSPRQPRGPASGSCSTTRPRCRQGAVGGARRGRRAAVHPAVSDAAGPAVLDALAAGTPVVATPSAPSRRSSARPASWWSRATPVASPMLFAPRGPTTGSIVASRQAAAGRAGDGSPALGRRGSRDAAGLRRRWRGGETFEGVRRWDPGVPVRGRSVEVGHRFALDQLEGGVPGGITWTKVWPRVSVTGLPALS